MKYFLRTNQTTNKWREVTQDEYLSAQKEAGMYIGENEVICFDGGYFERSEN